MKDSSSRLDAIRQQMTAQGVDALIVPRADEYLGEYIPEHNERLKWLSGFTGSAGLVIVTHDRAAIFVDGRYTVQVRQQVDARCFDIERLEEGAQLEWLKNQLMHGQVVAYDPRLHNLQFVETVSGQLKEAGLELIAIGENLIDLCWHERPEPQIHQAILLSERFTGRSSLEKRRDIGEAIARKGAEAAFIFAPDSVAWLLNIRGRDIPSLPLVLAHALLNANGDLQLFTEPEKIPAGFPGHVGEGVQVLPESELVNVLHGQSGRKILIDPNTANAWCQQQLLATGAEVLAVPDPVIMAKACKNAVEVEGMKQAHIRDGVAEVRFLAWLDGEVADGRLHDEAVLADKLFGFRSEQDDFQEVSFSTISAAGANAAMCHYNHLNGVAASLEMNSVYLVDSGGQYLDGTTDITRTVAIGDPGEVVRKMFTLVLKGHIALDCARFPDGTTGTQLDVLARQFLWAEGFDYDHGTGHGVGAFLSVHEGPQRIAKQHNAAPLSPGMVISNEPGYYETDGYGIRCENLVVVKRVNGRADSMMEFEAITLAPFDLRLVVPDLLTAAERHWLNSYHQRVYDTLSPLLAEPDRTWLENATRAIPG